MSLKVTLSNLPVEIKAKNFQYKDVTIPMPWGHIVGRWYGNQQQRPILALHGYMDNIGVWNNLIPLLPQHVGILCIDFPGHGLSPNIPPAGRLSHMSDFVYIIGYVMQVFKWEKVSIMAHSLGVVVTYVFAALCPHLVDMVICIDMLGPRDRDPSVKIETIRDFFENNLKAYENESRLEPKAYTLNELENSVHRRYMGSIDLQHCHQIVERNTQKSPIYPDKYTINSNDARTKYLMEYDLEPGLVLKLAERIASIPYCVLRVPNSVFIDEQWKHFKILESKNPLFECHTLEGTHHVHLNNAESVAAVLNPFLNRYRPLSLKTKSHSLDKIMNIEKQSKL